MLNFPVLRNPASDKESLTDHKNIVIERFIEGGEIKFTVFILHINKALRNRATLSCFKKASDILAHHREAGCSLIRT